MRGGAYPFYPCPCGSGKKYKFCCGPNRTGRLKVVDATAEAPAAEPGSGAMFEATPDWFKSPVMACYLNPEWKDARLASLLIARHRGGMVYAHAYLVDLMGSGLRDCYPLAPMSIKMFERNVLRVFKKRLGAVERAPYHEASRLVWSGLQVARDRGLELPRCVNTCARAAGERPAEEKLDLSLFEPVAPEEERLPLLSMKPVGGGPGKTYRVTHAIQERRVREHIRDQRAFAAFYGGNVRRWKRNEGGRLIMPLYTEEDLEGIRLKDTVGLRNGENIVCFSRAVYHHADMDDVVDSLGRWMDVKTTKDSGEKVRLGWEREDPSMKSGPFSLFRGSRQAMGEVIVTPMRLVLETRSRLFLYAGRIWIENALPGLVPVEFSYCSLQDLLP